IGQFLFTSLNNSSEYYTASNNFTHQRFFRKIPQGTMLPYFDEDSNHAYVIIPGFYKKTIRSEQTTNLSYTFSDSEKRTASNVFQLFDDIINWFKKISFEFQQNPPADLQAAVQTILVDPGFQNILKELSKYSDLDVL